MWFRQRLHLISDSSPSTINYTWDDRNRLKDIKQGSTTLASFQYDAFNRRTAKTIGGVSTGFLHDGAQIVQELDGTTPIANLLTGLQIDEIFRRTSSTTVEDFLSDALGSTIALADATGSIQTTYAYEPYGLTTPSGASGSVYQFTGRENDGGLYYYRNRYYSPTLHRFISQDPIGFSGGTNLYAYVGGDPISLTDPSGLSPFDLPFNGPDGNIGPPGLECGIVDVCKTFCKATSKRIKKNIYELIVCAVCLANDKRPPPPPPKPPVPTRPTPAPPGPNPPGPPPPPEPPK